jgi:hypothetical protein
MVASALAEPGSDQSISAAERTAFCRSELGGRGREEGEGSFLERRAA